MQELIQKIEIAIQAGCYDTALQLLEELKASLPTNQVQSEQND